MRPTLVLGALLAVAGFARADDKFIDLTPLLPPDANAATVIDVQAIYNSPLAQKEKWATQRPLPFPPTIYTAALASRIDPGSLSGGKWEVGVANPKGKLTMEQLAVREKGALETIAGAQAVLSPRNLYFVEIRPWVIGMSYPADRQEVAKWVKSLRNVPGGVVRLDPFLKASVTSGDRQTQFIMAIDLADAVDPARVLDGMIKNRQFTGNLNNPNAAAKVLGTVQGVKLTLMVTDTINGELRFEFGAPATPLMPWAKPLLTDFLAGRGASVEALENWTAEADGNAIVMRGRMREQGFRRILSLVAPPAPPADVGGTALAPRSGCWRRRAISGRFKRTWMICKSRARRRSRIIRNSRHGMTRSRRRSNNCRSTPWMTTSRNTARPRPIDCGRWPARCAATCWTCRSLSRASPSRRTFMPHPAGAGGCSRAFGSNPIRRKSRRNSTRRSIVAARPDRTCGAGSITTPPRSPRRWQRDTRERAGNNMFSRDAESAEQSAEVQRSAPPTPRRG